MYLKKNAQELSRIFLSDSVVQKAATNKGTDKRAVVITTPQAEDSNQYSSEEHFNLPYTYKDKSPKKVSAHGGVAKPVMKSLET